MKIILIDKKDMCNWMSLFKESKKLRCVSLVVGILVIEASVFAQNYTVVATTIPALTNAKTKWVDFNNDGLLDVFISGTNNLSALHTGVYISNGNNTFNTIGFAGLTDLAFDVGDYNHDGFIDILLTGINGSGVKKSSVFRNNNGSSFTEQSFLLTPLSKGGVVWRDLNNDGYLDILMTGLGSDNLEKTVVYAGNATGYIEITQQLPAISNGSLISFDATNDGWQEVLITGLTSEGNAISTIYTVNDEFTFTLLSELSPGFSFNSIAIGDYNNDGFTDLFISGLAGNGLLIETSLFQNNGVNGFSEVATPFINLSASSLVVGDLNTDGLADVIATGLDDATDKYFLYYTNSPSYTFTDEGLSLPNIYNGQAAFGDYDNDGDLDIFQIGNSDINFQANLYASDQSAGNANQVPVAPTNLQAAVTNTSVQLTWDVASDDFTDEASLTYAIYLSTDPNGANLFVAPLSAITTGKRRVVEHGNAGYATSKVFQNLPEGRYYWSVQTIDNGYAGSPFSAEQSFAICNAIDIGEDTTICHGEEIELSIGLPEDDVNWYSKTNGLLEASVNTFSYTVLQTDTIIAELTRPFACTVNDTIIIERAPLPMVNLGTDVAICFNERIEFEIPVTIDSVNWFNMNTLLLQDSRMYSYAVQAKDTIIVQAFSALKCVSYDSVIVDVRQLPVFTLGTDKAVCSKEETLLEVTGTWPMINWRSLQVGQLINNASTYLLEVLRTDTIEAEVIDVNGCKNYDSIRVEMLPLPLADLGEDKAICLHESTLLELPNNGTTVNWYTYSNEVLAADQYTYLQVVNEKDTVVVEVIDANSCVKRDTVIIDAIPLPVVNLGVDAASCFEDNIMLNAGGGFQRVDWFSKMNNASLVENSFFLDYSVLETDTLIARVQSPAGCINYDSIRIEMKPRPVYSLGTDKNICEGETEQLEIPGTWHEVQWYTVGDILLEPNNTTLEVTVEETITLWSVVKGLNGCVKIDTITITMLPSPTFDFGDDKVFCFDDRVNLSTTAPGIIEYVWTNAADEVMSTQSMYEFSALTTERIYLRVKDANGCAYTDSVLVSVNPLPDFEIAGNATICSEEEVTLSVSTNQWEVIEWYREESTTLFSDVQSIVVQPNANAEYFARLVDDNACTSIRSFVVTVNNRPIPRAGDDTLLCFGEHTTIGGDYENSSSLTFAWSPSTGLSDVAIANPIAEPLVTTTYVVTVTNENGCSETDEVYLEVNPRIVVDAGNNAGVCIGSSLTLGGQPTASGSQFPYSYQWSSDSGVIEGNDSNPVISPTESGLYYVFVTSGRCEVVYDSIQVTVLPLPQIEVGGDQSIGAGAAVTLSASGGVAYHWTPAESLSDNTAQFPQASPQVTTVYTVRVIDENGCESTGEVKVIVQNSLFIPKLFTPNGDGANDTFILYGSGIASLKFSIHDQNGNSVYYTENIEEAFTLGWDGTSNGKQMTNDIYFWTIDGKFFTGETIRFDGSNKGIIKLMR